MDDWQDVRERLRVFALGLPETHEDHPWGETVIKVNKKVFVFLGMDERSEKWDPSFRIHFAKAARAMARARWFWPELLASVELTE